MILLGFVLILLGVAAGLAVYLLATSANQSTLELSAFGLTVNVAPVDLLYAGLIILAVVWLGYVVLRSGFRSSAKRRAQAKVDAQRAKDEQAAREREWQAQHEAEVAARKEAEQKLAAETARNRAVADQGAPAEDTTDRA
ncbi:MAG: hypothetical protein ACK5MP_14155 [Nostocoides sp.]